LDLIRRRIPVGDAQTRPDQFRAVWARFGAFRTAVLGLCLGIAGGCGYTLAA
jgi:hypothetical protein